MKPITKPKAEPKPDETGPLWNAVPAASAIFHDRATITFKRNGIRQMPLANQIEEIKRETVAKFKTGATFKKLTNARANLARLKSELANWESSIAEGEQRYRDSLTGETSDGEDVECDLVYAREAVERTKGQLELAKSVQSELYAAAALEYSAAQGRMQSDQFQLAGAGKRARLEKISAAIGELLDELTELEHQQGRLKIITLPVFDSILEPLAPPASSAGSPMVTREPVSI